jgi:chemotaxis signal transduction protein
MSATIASGQSFVVFPLGDRRFALPTVDVVELSRNGRAQKFPHTSAALEGVLVRRGEVLPVWDLAKTLLGCQSAIWKMWLVTRCNFSGEELTAIPVSGECQMVHAQTLLPAEGAAGHVLGVLMVENQPVEVLDLRGLRTHVAMQRTGSPERQEKGITL